MTEFSGVFKGGVIGRCPVFDSSLVYRAVAKGGGAKGGRAPR